MTIFQVRGLRLHSAVIGLVIAGGLLALSGSLVSTHSLSLECVHGRSPLSYRVGDTMVIGGALVYLAVITASIAGHVFGFTENPFQTRSRSLVALLLMIPFLAACAFGVAKAWSFKGICN